MSDSQSAERRTTSILRPIFSDRRNSGYCKSNPNRRKRASTIGTLVTESNQLLADETVVTVVHNNGYTQEHPILLCNGLNTDISQPVVGDTEESRLGVVTRISSENVTKPIMLSVNSSSPRGRPGISQDSSLPCSASRRSQRIANQGGSPDYARIAYPMRRLRVTAPREMPADAPDHSTTSTLPPHTSAVMEDIDLPPARLDEQRISSFWHRCLRYHLSYGEATDDAHVYDLIARPYDLASEHPYTHIAECRKFGGSMDIGFLLVQFRDTSGIAQVDWNLGEYLLTDRLPAVYRYHDDGTAKAVHGAVVIGKYVRFYKSQEEGQIVIFPFEDERDTLHIEINYSTIIRHLTAIREEWERERPEPEVEEWMTWLNLDYY
ncbi:hypothetical protein ASPCADRAFT_4188 [Aspergillus carbonarius ITEM 5010]|uniref:Uncharacterized protein n=1 Tax=Aspergillus carbonarius (strain ITEM 5010) TaxID=602072 RepID=A0A1R3RSY6_ASPC5|nr:hypothetical protein ASPCADRAFT_4188 [Aspergillus carbonarius ITEM 5010]